MDELSSKSLPPGSAGEARGGLSSGKAPHDHLPFYRITELEDWEGTPGVIQPDPPAMQKSQSKNPWGQVFVLTGLLPLLFPKQGGQAACGEGEENHLAASQELACTRTRGTSHKPVCSQAQQAYARQLACMEQELEGFLSEVRNRRNALGDIVVEERCPQNTERGQDKLRITVYEISDTEGSGRPQQRGRRRKMQLSY